MNSHHPISSQRPGTLCVHAGTHHDERTAGVCSPVFASSAFRHPHPSGENVYPRYFNVPNQRIVARKIAALEQGEDGLVFSSGMAAIATVMFAFLAPGDHAVFQSDLYGGTHHFIEGELARWGVGVSFAPTAEEIARAVRKETRVVYVESPSNPLLRCVDLAAVGRLGRERGVLTVIDNTFATPINQTPLTLGFDLSLHSGTKYLNGHSDLNCGAAVGSSDHIARVRKCAMNLGGSLEAHACHLLERGLKTLALRVRQQNDNALRLARYLEAHPAVARVNYPGLASHPDHAIAAGQMRGFGGMLSFELREADRIPEVLQRFRLVTPALSLGGVETLICVPAQTSHVAMAREQRLACGITDGLMRVSVGIEEADDVLEDFARALDAV